MRPFLFLVVVVAACGSSNGTGPHDAAIDSRPDTRPDTPPDALIDAPLPPSGHLHLVEDHVMLPRNNTEARTYGLDLDANGTVDNQLGMVIATFAGMGIDIPMLTQTAVDTGAMITLLDVTDQTVTAGTFASFVGATPMPAACASSADTTCRHHLTGSATFTIPTTAPTNPALAGGYAAGMFTAGPGHLTVQLLWPGAPPVVLTLIGARVKLSQVTATGIGAGVIAGAISQYDITNTLEPAMRDGFEAQVMHDCTALTSPPGCGCIDGSSGKTAIGLFDTNHDCSISVDEVRNNSLIMSLLAPDVTIENMQALSLGFGVTAVGAGFVTP